MPDLDINLENDTQLVELGQVFSIVEMLGKLAAITKKKKFTFKIIVVKISKLNFFLEMADRSQLPA